MLTSNKRAKEFRQIASECDKRAKQEDDQAQKSVLRGLAAYYLRLAQEALRGPYG